MNRHHSRALATITAAVILDVGLGFAFSAVTPHMTWWHGMFCALANAVTDGGDSPPVNPAGYAVTALEYLTVVPLFAATLSLFTSGLTSSQVADHVEGSESRIKQHVEDRLAAAHPQSAIFARLDSLGEAVSGLAETIRVVTAARTQHTDEPAGDMPADIPARAEKTLRRPPAKTRKTGDGM